MKGYVDMKYKFPAVIISAALLFVSMTGCGEKKTMNTETSRIVMDDFINQEQYAIKITYQDMNFNFYYSKDGDREFLGTTMANVQSGVIRLGNLTYYIDLVGSGKMRCIENDTTDMNYARELLNTIYKQTVVNGTLTNNVSYGEGEELINYDYYDYNDPESGEVIQWKIAVQYDKLLQAERISDGRIFDFEYPVFSDVVFDIPDDYIIVDDDGNPVDSSADSSVLTSDSAEQAVS